MAIARQPFSIQHSALPARRAGSGERPASIQHSALSIQHSESPPPRDHLPTVRVAPEELDHEPRPATSTDVHHLTARCQPSAKHEVKQKCQKVKDCLTFRQNTRSLPSVARPPLKHASRSSVFARIAYSPDAKSVKITHGGIKMGNARRAPCGGGSDFPLFSKDGKSGVKEWTGLVGQGRESKPFEGFPVEVFLSA